MMFDLHGKEQDATINTCWNRSWKKLPVPCRDSIASYSMSVTDRKMTSHPLTIAKPTNYFLGLPSEERGGKGYLLCWY